MDRPHFQAHIAVLPEALCRTRTLGYATLIAAVALTFGNLGFGRPLSVGRERTA